jgi:hypothetical protein
MTMTCSSLEWKPIDTELNDGLLRLVSDDPSNPNAAHLVKVTAGGLHFNGHVVIEAMGTKPTHWHPVPVSHLPPSSNQSDPTP